jgi:hypothetical protein
VTSILMRIHPDSPENVVHSLRFCSKTTAMHFGASEDMNVVPKFGLFAGLLAPWKGVLLYGPPGQSSGCRILFFVLNGDCERMLEWRRCSFRVQAPSTPLLR